MSWSQLADIDFLGTSPFQNLFCREIRKFLPEIEFVEIGEFEKAFVADVPSTDIEISLYFDSIILRSPTADLMFESYRFRQPKDLVARVIAELSNSM